MPRTSKEIAPDSHKLNKLVPSYASKSQVEMSAKHAEKHGDKGAGSNNERKIGAHLLRLERLLSRKGVEKRVWDSATRELIINEDDIPESFWAQQLQLARDNGLGDVRLTRQQRELTAQQLQDAQRTGLESWRNYLEQSGDQYPVWFKVYAWEGMSQLGIFDQAKQHYRKRSKGTVAPYPLLNPAALAKVYEVVKGGDKTESFNTLYSRMLLEQKASIPTPENPEEVHGEWREYTHNDIEAITHAAQATPWCIAGAGMADSYTRDGGKFLLFHLQDPETGVFSPTACASIRLDADGRVVELSGLKGGSAQYLEDALIPTVQEKVKTLPGGERYLEAFADKQMLIEMDKKFQAGEPFTEEEILFLYETERPIRYLDTYANDPRPEQFRRNREQHIEQIAEIYGGALNAELVLDPIDPTDYIVHLRVGSYLKRGMNPDFLANRLTAIQKAITLPLLIEAGAHIDANELADQLPVREKLQYFDVLKDAGATVTADEIAEPLSKDEKLQYFGQLKDVGLTLTADELAGEYDEGGKLNHLIELKIIGAHFDVDELVIRKYGQSEVIGLKAGVSIGMMSYLLRGGASPELMLKMLKMAESQEQELYREGGVYASGAVEALKEIIKAVPQSGADQAHFIDLFYKKLRENPKTFVGNYGGGTHGFMRDFLGSGFNVNIVAAKLGVDDRNLADFMERGVDRDILLDAMVRKNARGRRDYPETYSVRESIEKLLEYGCNIADITRHITPDYQFDVFDRLQEHGAQLDINAIVAAMRPGDVISRVARIRERGIQIDVNDTLRKAQEGDVYEHKVYNLMVAGADPSLVAEKISTHRYVGEFGHIKDYEWQHLDSLKKGAPEVYEAFRKRLDEAIQKGREAKEEAYKKARERQQAEQKAAQNAAQS